MTTRKKVWILAISCAMMIALLCWIQYQLVQNTYDLKAKSYFNEVREKLDTIHQPFADSANHRAVKALTENAALYLATKDRQQFLDSISTMISQESQRDKNRLTRLLDSAFGDPPVRFSMAYVSIVLAVNGVNDTLLTNTDPPFIILGEPFAEAAVRVGEGVQTNTFNGTNIDPATRKPLYTFILRYTKKADISGWQQRVVRRMAGTFILAAVLLLGIVILFYAMFRTLLHQKRMADIQVDLTNNITHELRTPLSSLSIIVKSLRNTSVREHPAVYDDLVSSLERQRQKLSHIVDRVLESAWVMDAPLRMQQHEMNELVWQIAIDFPMDTHSLTLNPSEDKVWMSIDEYVLTSIMHNLLDNAVKYSEPGTAVEMTCRVEERHYVIAIKDRGIGITSSEREKIFGKFYRVTERNRHTVKGIGLGLYICQVNAKRLNASLSVESEPSKGSTFVLRIPRQ